MPRNPGIVDQMVRAIIGLTLLAYFKDDFQGLGLASFLGAYLLAIALFLCCPLYGILGLSADRRLDRSA